MPSYINPEQIFPKRLGIMNGSTLVLQYYNLGKDKFKKHLMSFDTSTQTKNIVEQIFKNPKHIPFLKKVNPKHITSVLQGQRIGFRQQPQNNFQQFYQPSKEQAVTQRIVNEGKENIYQEFIQKHQEIEAKHKNDAIEKPSFEFQRQTPKVQVPDQYYNEEFEDFQISASMDRKSNLSSNFSKIQPSVPEKSSFSKSDVSKIEPAKEKKPEKKKVVQEVIQDYNDDFQFIDEDQQKKQKKQKKEKKEKSKNKSKQKKSKKQKDSKKQQKKELEVQEQFQFL